MEETKEQPEHFFHPEMLRGKVALVTGGGTGIGRNIAHALARSGASIALYGRREEMLRNCASEIEAYGGETLCVRGDTREETDIERLMNTIGSRFGQLDILINNAGGQFAGAAKDISNKGFEAVIRNNLIASWQVTSACAHHFMFDRGGKVIFITAAHRAAMPAFAHTAAARAGVAAMMRTLAVEWAEYNILLNAIAPGTIKVEAMGQYPIPQALWESERRNLVGRLGEPRDIANLALFLASPMSDFVTGEEWYVDGGETINLAHDTRRIIDAAMFSERRRADADKSN